MKQLVDFSFLDDLELQPVEKVSAKLGIMDKQPEGARIRLFADGRVFPSDELIQKFQLQYVNKGNPEQGNGFDVFTTKEWGQWPMNANHNLVLIAPVSKTLAKVDLFSSTKYDEDGAPKADVATQGTRTFGKTLIDTLKDTYGDDVFPDDQVYLDLEIKEDKPLPPTNNGVYTVPKVVSRGKNAGKVTYERRENLTIYPLVPVTSEESADTVTTQDATATETTATETTVPTPDGMENSPAENNTPAAESDVANQLFH